MAHGSEIPIAGGMVEGSENRAGEYWSDRAGELANVDRAAPVVDMATDEFAVVLSR